MSSPIARKIPPAAPDGSFAAEQKEYLQGFMAGVMAGGVFVGATANGRLTGSPASAGTGNLAAGPPPGSAGRQSVFGAPLSELSKPERWKLDENPLDIWEKLVAHAEGDKFPDEADTFRFKFHGLFYVAPAQDSFMLRLRIPACEITAHQFRGVADLAAELGGGCAHVTTRGNLQVRELRPRNIVKALTRVQELGLTSRGAGADNIRNITATPTSGFDPAELLDVRPHAKALHHYILNHRDLYGLPRKFNVAFDSGGSVSVASDTNDIGFLAVRVAEKPAGACLPVRQAQGPEPPAEGQAMPSGSEIASKLAPATRPDPGVYFRVQLGGVTGHGDFARDAGLLVKPSEVVAVAAAMIRVFNESGDRANRKKARLKYLLEKWGLGKFLSETQKRLAFPLVHLPVGACEPRRPPIKHGWLGVYRQAQRGLNYIGVGLPVGRMSSPQMRRLAELAANYGRGELRLTVWQNVIIPHVPDAFVETVRRALHRVGFHTESSTATGGIVACTGSTGCRYSSTDTKGHAAALGKALSGRMPLEAPVNIHFTGCPHSCAQHYCGDIGLLGAKLQDGTEGYHVVLGGGVDNEQGLAREILRGVRAGELNGLVEKILRAYAARKRGGETFAEWSRRHSVGGLQEILAT